MIIDAGDREREVIEHLQHDFGSWPLEHFDQFCEHDFERYYPSCFQEKVEEVLALPGNSKDEKKKKREAKSELRIEVMRWIDEDRNRARKEFECSAREVIGKLRKIETRLFENSNL